MLQGTVGAKFHYTREEHSEGGRRRASQTEALSMSLLFSHSSLNEQQQVAEVMVGPGSGALRLKPAAKPPLKTYKQKLSQHSRTGCFFVDERMWMRDIRPLLFAPRHLTAASGYFHSYCSCRKLPRGKRNTEFDLTCFTYCRQR
ncbi:hypothetical protein MHYP_G00132340 [Metynnis hypsauchen]